MNNKLIIMFKNYLMNFLRMINQKLQIFMISLNHLKKLKNILRKNVKKNIKKDKWIKCEKIMTVKKGE